MKTLILVRHAKTKEAVFGESDFVRELTSRGRSDAEVMSGKIKDQGLFVDYFVTSAAKRTKQTCKIFYHILKAKNAIYSSHIELYNALDATYLETIIQFPDTQNTVAIFGHNPGILLFANQLLDNETLESMPTCGILVLQADVTEWKNFMAAPKEKLFFESPKSNS